MKLKDFIGIGALAFLLLSCSTGKLRKLRTDDDRISFIFLQMNDVGEIAPMPGSNKGGLARVASISKQLMKESSSVFIIVSGGLLNPSPINKLKLDGSEVNGKHTIEVMNKLGVDMVTFGSHAFELDEYSLQSRIDSSNFLWLSSNIKKIGQDTILPFTQSFWGHQTEVPETAILNVIDEDGTFLKVGIFSVTNLIHGGGYAVEEDALTKAKFAYEALKPKVDFTIAITHLSYKEDVRIAQSLPELRLMMGGYDKQNMAQMIDKTLIAKADANAASVYVHRFNYNKSTKELTLDSELINIDEFITEDPQLRKLIEAWQHKTSAKFQEQGFDVDEVIATTSIPYDGSANSLNNRLTNLGDLILKAMLSASVNAECALINSGFVELDDVLQDEITQYDIMRSIPNGSSVITVKMDGSLLYEILRVGIQSKGTGSFLQMRNIDPDIGINSYYAGKRKISPGQQFTVALPSHFISGNVKNFEFLNAEHPGIVQVDETENNDIRKVVIQYLKEGKK